MTTTSAVTLAVWALVAGRLAVLGSRHLRVRALHSSRSEEWHPRVTSGCGR